MEDIWLTPEEITKREERLEYLKTAKRLEIAEQLKIARAFGDLSENAEYDAAKNEQAKNEYDIQQLENELKNAKVIDENAIDYTTVGVGATVKLSDMNDKTKKTWFLLDLRVTRKIFVKNPVSDYLCVQDYLSKLRQEPESIQYVTRANVGRSIVKTLPRRRLIFIVLICSFRVSSQPIQPHRVTH